MSSEESGHQASPRPPDPDLDSCAQEPIHLLGSIQPFGVLLAARDGIVTHVSANFRAGGIEGGRAIGRPLQDLLDPPTWAEIQGRLPVLDGTDAVERLYRRPLLPGGTPQDIALHRLGELLVVEAEPTEIHGPSDTASTVRGMVSQLNRSAEFSDFTQQAADQVRRLTGFDRVMVYRFEQDGAGEVIAESADAGIDRYIGQRYPAADIPSQARTLYTRNWLRLIADLDASNAPLLQAARDTAPLDLSMSTLRAVSGVHLEYLRNMGIGASMSISIIHQGRLWGLFACHHMAPRLIGAERRVAAELFGQMFSLLLESRSREAELHQESQARQVHDRLMAAVAADGGGIEHVFDFLPEFCRIFHCDGIGVWAQGRATLHELTPDPTQFRALIRFLNREAGSSVLMTPELGALFPPAQDYSEIAAGMLAIPISRSAGDYLVFFRRELARTVTWAGKPDKVVTIGPLGARLTPRKSFEAWQQEVRGQSRPWTEIDRRIAEILRVSLLDIVLRLTDAAEEERRRAQQRQELLIAELNHRVRNILGLIRGLISQSRSGVRTIDEFMEVIGGRVQALARAHDLITRDQWGPAPLAAMIHAEAGAYLTSKAVRLVATGPAVLLEPAAFSTLALVMHELITNSAKYGALKDGIGKVRLSWRADEIGNLQIDWLEEGGPAVLAPSRRGFGSTIIERSIPFDLKGEARVEFALTGLRAHFTIPASYVQVTEAAPAEAPAPAPRRPENAPLAGRVLLVEDNIIIAMDAQDMLRRLGAQQVDTASSAAMALAAIDRQAPGFALLDVNLGQGTSLPVAEKLTELGIPFAFATGYGEDISALGIYAQVPVVRKPYTLDTLRAALRG